MSLGQCVGRGGTADVFEWGANQVLKLFHPRHDVDKEVKKARTIHQAGLPLRTPEVISIVQVEGRTGIIYEKIEGTTMLQLIQPTSTSLTYYAKLLATLHLELHQIKVKLPSNLKQEIRSRLVRFSERESLSEGQIKKIDSYIQKLPDESRVCHYDFHPGNIILTAEGPVVIDWNDMVVGHPCADVCKTSLLFKGQGVPPAAPKWLKDRSNRLYFHDVYMAEYFKDKANEEIENLGDWLLPTQIMLFDQVTESERAEILHSLLHF